MMKLSRADRILETVTMATRAFDPGQASSSLARLQIPAISAKTGISANNISMELGRLHRSGLLLRVGGRPVAYFSLRELEEVLGCVVPSNQFDSAKAFLAYVAERRGAPASAAAPVPQNRLLNPSVVSNLDGLVGATDSLSNQIRQAKAAVIYPPNGLHTLFTGATGTGKSLFAKCMFDYAVKSNALPPGASIVTFDCAHYSENPQLVLSQLFGYAKGSFTGAEKDHSGLVEYADGGILFLDEIHRLTPEGQEKMFLLIDNGTFRRLGETGNYRHAKLLIIGATTEDPKRIMLNTFLRRIPVHITLPELEKRTVQERLSLVLYFIWTEARNIKTRIFLAPDMLSMLVHYRCPANVGQLASDIKLTCANAYYSYLTGASKLVEIYPKHLSERVNQGLFALSTPGCSPLIRQMLRFPDKPVDVNGSVGFHTMYGQYVIS